MTNRYLSSDQTKWFGPTHIGAGQHDPAKRITKFVFDGPDGSAVSKLRTAYVDAVDAVSTLRAKRREAEGSNRFTPMGIAEHLAEGAMTGNIPALRRARSAVERVQAEIAD